MIIAVGLVGAALGMSAEFRSFSSPNEPHDAWLPGENFKTVDPPREDYTALVEALRATTLSLEREVSSQRRTISGLQHELANLEERLSRLDSVGGAAGTNAAATRRTDDQALRRDAFDRGAGSDRIEQLVAAGIARQTAQQLILVIEETNLAHLQSENAAPARDSVRVARVLRDFRLPDELVRERFGEDVYDRYLYATGRANRVRIANVLANSGAEAAGVRAGDQLLTVSGERIYSLSDLKHAVDSAPGETLYLEIQRRNEFVQLSLPRGPLGIEAVSDARRP